METGVSGGCGDTEAVIHPEKDGFVSLDFRDSRITDVPEGKLVSRAMMAGKRYLTGPDIFYRTDGHSTIVSLTMEDIYRFQTYLESHSTTLMADGQKLTCICID